MDDSITRQEWSAKMRKQFSPAEMLDEHGGIKQV